MNGIKNNKTFFLFIKDFFKYSFSKEKILFHNWFKFKQKKEIWFHEFVVDKKIPIKQRIIFTSVAGKRNPFLKYFIGKKVFFTGENVEESSINNNRKKYQDYLLNEVDLSLGFRYMNHPKYMRFPLWLCCTISSEDSLETIREKIANINNPKHRLNADRKEFACLIAGHDKTGIRSKILQVLQKIDKVTCAGKFNKNTNDLQEKWEDNKIAYLSQFKFNICPENSSENGYVTEKIFQSIIAGCIPIYNDGGRVKIEPKILNQEAFLRYEEGKEEELFQKVSELMNDEEKYREFCNIPPFKEGAAEVIWEWITELEKRLREL